MATSFVRVIPFAAAFVLRIAFSGATDVWAASLQECTPTELIPPGGRCLADDQCEFGECDPIYNFCRERCCSASGGNTCSGTECWPSAFTRRTTHCGAGGASWNLFPCRLGQPDVGGLKCKGNLQTASPRPPPGLCSSFKNMMTNTSNSEGLDPVRMDLTDPRCGCTSAVKELWTAGAFVGHWSSSNSFVSACGGGSVNVTGNVVVLTMVVHNVRYGNLTSNGPLLSAFKGSIKALVSSAAGHKVTHLDVAVEITEVAAHVTAGSMPTDCRGRDRRCRTAIAVAKVTATINVQRGVSPASVQTQLSSSSSLTHDLATGLQAVAGMPSELEVSNVIAVVGSAVVAGSVRGAEAERIVVTAAPQLRGGVLGSRLDGVNLDNGGAHSTGVEVALAVFVSVGCCVSVALFRICLRKGSKLSRVHDSDTCVTAMQLSSTPCYRVSHFEPQPTVLYPGKADGHHLTPDWSVAKFSPRPSVASNASTRPPSPTPSSRPSVSSQSTIPGTPNQVPHALPVPGAVPLYNGRRRGDFVV